jgi:hypothetical protein
MNKQSLYPADVLARGIALLASAWRLRSPLVRRALAIALPLAAGLALGLSATAQTRAVVHQVSDEEAAAAISYWTPERQASAIPFPMEDLAAKARPLSAGHVQPDAGNAPGGPPGFDPAGLPLDFYLKGRPSPYNPVIPPWTGNCSDCSGAAYANCNLYSTNFVVPFDAYSTAGADLPFRAVGKVFFTIPPGGLPFPGNYVCSGASIGGSAVLTAGHCVGAFGGFYTNWAFVPEFNQYTTAEGYGWVATQLITFPEFLNDADMGRDVGFAVVKGYPDPDTNPDAPPICADLSDVAGNLGFAWNQDLTRANWSVFGYPILSFPSLPPYPGYLLGLNMVQTNSVTGCRNDNLSPPSVGIGSSMGGGASGGPWLLDFRPTLTDLFTNLVGGINSYVPNYDFTQIYSPYFDQAVKNMKDQAVHTRPTGLTPCTKP